MEERKAEAEVVADLVKELHEPELLALPGGEVSVLLTPAGFSVQSIKKHLDEYLTKPERRKGTAELTRLESFIAHVNRFKDDDSVLFADSNQKAPRLTAVFDYNQSGPHNADARFGQHRAAYSFPLSDEWKTWTDKNETAFDLQKFASFIEDNLLAVVDPGLAGEGSKLIASSLGVEFASPQKLMDLSRNFSVNASQSVVNAVNLQTGESQIQFKEVHQDAAGAPIKVPGAFLLGISVFENGDKYQIPARLRYTKSGQTLLWKYALYRTDQSFEVAFSEACEKAAKETGLPLFFGGPEQ